jgi:ABC-type sugar transport system ATPase subunit
MNLLTAAAAMRAAGRSDLIVGMPQDVVIVAAERADARARVEVIEALGRELLCHVTVEDATPRVLASADAPMRKGEQVGLAFRGERLHFFDAASGKRR